MPDLHMAKAELWRQRVLTRQEIETIGAALACFAKTVSIEVALEEYGEMFLESDPLAPDQTGLLIQELTRARAVTVLRERLVES